jgi:hypothetical protein
VVGQAVGIAREQQDDLGARNRVQVVLGNQCDDLVTLIAPSGCRMRYRCGGSEKKASQEKCFADRQASITH